MGNKKEFKALIKRYKSITLDDIKSYPIHNAATVLTGFGSNTHCTLCQAVEVDCEMCMWIKITGEMCNCHNNTHSYDNVYYAKTPKKLLKAFKKRAKYMKKVLTNK